MTSPGTSSRAGGLTHFPSRWTRALIASLAFSAAMALPAWCSSQNPTTALATSSTQDDAEVRPMPDDRREDHRRFDHPRDRTPEIGEKFQKRDWSSSPRSRSVHIEPGVSPPRPESGRPGTIPVASRRPPAAAISKSSAERSRFESPAPRTLPSCAWHPGRVHLRFAPLPVADLRQVLTVLVDVGLCSMSLSSSVCFR